MNQVILNEGVVDDCSLYLIVSGQVTIYHQKTNSKIACLKSGETFGEIGFFTSNARKASVKCDTFTSLIQLTRDDFIEILKEFEKDYEIFCIIRD